MALNKHNENSTISIADNVRDLYIWQIASTFREFRVSILVGLWMRDDEFLNTFNSTKLKPI